MKDPSKAATSRSTYNCGNQHSSLMMSEVTYRSKDSGGPFLKCKCHTPCSDDYGQAEINKTHLAM